MVENENSKSINLGRAYLLQNYGIPLMKEVGFHTDVIEFIKIVIQIIRKFEDRILNITSEKKEYNKRDYLLARKEILNLLSVEKYNSSNEKDVITEIVEKTLKNNKGREIDIRRLFENIVIQINRYLGNNFDTLTNEIDGKYSESSFPNWLYQLNSRYPFSKMPKVFLSHAYTDQLFTISLFKYLYDNGIYLYVDWMHNGKLGTPKLKDKLINELKSSHQILFLRTLNSELKLRGGNNQIRQWCAWEIGCFDYINQSSNNKFYINYYVDNTVPQTEMINGYKVMTGITPNIGIL